MIQLLEMFIIYYIRFLPQAYFLNFMYLQPDPV